jgi:hypothetical protein
MGVGAFVKDEVAAQGIIFESYLHELLHASGLTVDFEGSVSEACGGLEMVRQSQRRCRTQSA